MVGRWPFESLEKYPHLSEKESEIWTRFIQKYPDFCQRVDYDVIVGEGPMIPEGIRESWRRDAKYLGSYKIDAVGYKGKIHYIIEIKQRAGPSALGQIVSYMALYQEKLGKYGEAEPVLITDLERPDIRKLCREHDIAYYVV